MATNETLEGKPFLGVSDTVYISGHVYPKTKAASAALTDALKQRGHSIDEDGKFAKLDDIHKAQCGHCDSIISPVGVRTHNHKCECCHKPTFIEWSRGGIITFLFMRDFETIGSDITFRIHGYRPVTKELLLYADPILEPTEDYRPGFFAVQTKEKADALLKETSDLYRRLEIKIQGKPTKLIAIPLTGGVSGF